VHYNVLPIEHIIKYAKWVGGQRNLKHDPLSI
jgi:hypothetical protein